MNDDLKDVVDAIVRHHVDEPRHGVSCACMDSLIQRFRKLTTVSSEIKFLQRRVDYVIRAAIDNRPPSENY